MKSSEFLLVDIGNTLLKWAVAGVRGPIRIKGERPTAKATAANIAALAKKYPRHHVVVASVVPKVIPLFRRAFKGRIHLVTGTSPALGLHFDYPKPSEIGADRLAAAVAVQADEKWPAIIVSCGTADAFTVLDAKGRLCGGVIAPGLFTLLASLIHATAQLPSAVLRKPHRVLGRSTEEAIRAGVMLSFQGAVNEILNRLSTVLKVRHPHIVLTGGNARYLTGTLDLPYTLRPLLVFEGLRIIGIRAFIEV